MLSTQSRACAWRGGVTVKFALREQNGGLLQRRDVANALTAIAPVDTPSTDYQRGYIAALIRVGLVFGVDLVEQPHTLVVEVL